MDVGAYLRRIDYHGPLDPTIETLRELHTAHLLAVPFENLSIHLGQPIVLGVAALFNKIVERRRGGFCYELNGLFAALLRELGFDVTLLSAGASCEGGGFGPEFDHMALLVYTSVDRGQGAIPQPPMANPQSSTRAPGGWLADVGFGDSFRQPLRFDAPDPQVQDGWAYRLTHEDARWTLLRRDDDQTWDPQYIFTLQPCQYADFAGMCHYHQTSPESHFTRRRVCTRATPEGRITLSDMCLIITAHGEQQKRPLDDKEYTAALREYFGIDLDEQMKS